QRQRTLGVDGGKVGRINRVKCPEQVELHIIVLRCGIAQNCNLNGHGNPLTETDREARCFPRVRQCGGKQAPSTKLQPPEKHQTASPNRVFPAKTQATPAAIGVWRLELLW